MADENNDNQATETDIFQQQKKTIDTLIEVLERREGQLAQPVYVSPPAPAAKPPNYLLYIGLAIAAFFLFK